MLAALSFHETKNVIAGEGGALLVNHPAWVERAEILWEKGTNRTRFARGEIDKYTWIDVGSSFLPSEIIAAFLWAQFEEAPARSPTDDSRSGTGITRRSKVSSSRGVCAGPSSRNTAATTLTCST